MAVQIKATTADRIKWGEPCNASMRRSHWVIHTFLSLKLNPTLAASDDGLQNLQLDLKNQEPLWSPHTYQKKHTLNTILPGHTTCKKVTVKQCQETTSLLPPPSLPATLNLKNQEPLRPPHTLLKDTFTRKFHLATLHSTSKVQSDGE